MEHEMNEGRPKSWDKTKRVYEISYPNGKKEIWKDITARECLTKYENMNPYDNRLKLRKKPLSRGLPECLTSERQLPQ